MNRTAIRVEGLSKRYRIGINRGRGVLRERLSSVVRTMAGNGNARTRDDLFWALRDVSFSVSEGEVLGVIGRNGAGKSTLLKILSRIVEPTEGRVEIHGRVGSLLEVGTGFHPELTGRENIYLNGTILGMKRLEIERRFDEIVEFADTAQFLDTPVKRYSSGMYTRLAFAVAAHLEPEILIVDEVLAVGDAAFQEKCLGKMREVAGQGRTVLYVSHNLPSVAALCGHALMLHQGRVTGYGVVRDIVEQYLGGVQPSAMTPLEHRTDRSGDGSVTVVAVYLDSEDPDGVIRVTSRLRLSIDYRADAPVRYPAVRVGIDDHGVGIFGLGSDIAGGLPDELPAEGRICCSTDPINLAPGRYYVHVVLQRCMAEPDTI